MSIKEEFLTADEIEQMFAEERLDNLRQKLIEEAKFRKEHPCYPCDQAVLGIITHSQSAIEELEALREMDQKGLKEKIMQGKFTYSKGELEFRIKEHKDWIQKNWDRYTNCCNTGYIE